MLRSLVLVLIISLLAACQPADAEPRDDETLTVFAAASLTEAMENLAEVFQDQNPHVSVRLNLAGSSTLAAQIEEGADVDVFASANMQQMQRLDDLNLLPSEAQVFARNRLVVITHIQSGIGSLGDLAGDDVKIVVAAPGVPVREYTEVVLEKLAMDYGNVFRDKIIANTVSEESSVRAVVLKVSLGEADAGFVYQTDVTDDAAQMLSVISIPDRYNILAAYPIALMTESEVGREFIRFVLSAEGQSILTKWGFIE